VRPDATKIRRLVRQLPISSLGHSLLLIPFARKPPEEDPAVYRDLFDQARDGRLVLDPQAQILHANPAAAQLFGASEERLRGVPFTELLAPAARPGFTSALATIRKPPARLGPIAIEGRFSDGSTFPIELEVVHGAEKRYGVVVRDARTSDRHSPPPAGRFNPGQVLIAGRIQELV
jgi:PAS domain S-box-containing protein